MAEEVQFIY